MRYRRFFALFAAPLLAGCSSLDNLMPPHARYRAVLRRHRQALVQPAKTTGLAVSDEPFAAQTGAAILAEGGSAADAVAAMFFTLSVTYPVAAGLGGGGICLVRDADGRTREFDFLARAANSGGAFAVPGAVAGFYDMQKSLSARCPGSAMSPRPKPLPPPAFPSAMCWPSAWR